MFLNDLITNYSDKYDVNALVLHGWIYRPDEVPDWIQLTDKFSRKKEFKQLNQSFQLSAGKNIMQLDSININKAIGLNKLCAKELTTTGNSNSNSSSIGSHNMDVTYENVCTFGNDSNDYQMLQWSKYSYALRGSYQKVYESAKSITKYQCQNYGGVLSYWRVVPHPASNYVIKCKLPECIGMHQCVPFVGRLLSPQSVSL